jgi:UDP-N-acetylmuramate--alanine ligase
LRTLKLEFVKCFKNTDQLILCPVYAAGESIDKKYNSFKFAKLISKFSKVQVVIVENELDIVKYLKKILISDEVVIGMGAGSISKWMSNLKNNL